MTMGIKAYVDEETCQKRITALNERIEQNNDIQVLSTFNNEFQVEAYKALKESQNKEMELKDRHDERTHIIKSLTKIAAMINALIGALSVVLELFL